jgi:hypothetical protein
MEKDPVNEEVSRYSAYIDVGEAMNKNAGIQSGASNDKKRDYVDDKGLEGRQEYDVEASRQAEDGRYIVIFRNSSDINPEIKHRKARLMTRRMYHL